MKKSLLLFHFCILLLTSTNAQTWTGTLTTDWNTAGNWSPASVPTGASNVTIPGSVVSNRWPVFASAVTINSLVMTAGCQLDVNSFPLTTGDFSINGGAINNSNVSSDIVLNLNGGATNYFRGCTINDNSTINVNCANTFYEGYQAGNTYNGNTIYNIAASSQFYISFTNPDVFNGNLTINRTVAGNSNIFNVSTAVNGNFSYTNNVGGGTSIGQAGTLTPVTGTFSITANLLVSPSIGVYRIKNQTTGGAINVQKAGYVLFNDDTLLKIAFYC